MKAFILKNNGGPEQLEMKKIAEPHIGDDEVLVEIEAISINPVDGFVRKNAEALQAIVQPKSNEHIIFGWDISGTVKALGNAVRDLKIGDDVFGLINFYGHGRAYAEYVAAPASQLTLKPENISHEEAAAACLAALTAWQGLVNWAHVKKGDKVLIHGASGGVGHYAVQLAKHFGAYVMGTGSSPKRDFVLSIGADEFIDYTSEKFEDKVRDADIALDPIFGDHILRTLDAVKPGGKVISLLTYFEGEVARKAKENNVSGIRLSVTPSGEDIKQIAHLLHTRALVSHVTHRYNFNELPEAHKQIDTGKTMGKVVVVVKD